LLLLDASVLRILTLSVVPAGIVTSRMVGAAGAAAADDGAAAELDDNCEDVA
jgi:hypothetical protein